MKDAPIVLLDEATASLDPENEVHIQDAINDLVKEKTVVIIAHRLGTVIGANNIVVIDQGRGGAARQASSSFGRGRTVSQSLGGTTTGKRMEVQTIE